MNPITVTADGKLTKKRWFVQSPQGYTFGQYRLKNHAVARARREARRTGVVELSYFDVDHRGYPALFLQAKVYDDGSISKV